MRTERSRFHDNNTLERVKCQIFEWTFPRTSPLKQKFGVGVCKLLLI